MAGFEDRIVIPKDEKHRLQTEVKKSRKESKPNLNPKPKKDHSGCGCFGCMGGCLAIFIFFGILVFLLYYASSKGMLPFEGVVEDVVNPAISTFIDMILGL